MEAQDWSEQFNSLLSSPLGRELLRTLKEDLHDNMLVEAERKLSQEEGFGLLKQASGVTLAIEHLKFKAVTPKDEGSKSN